MKNLKNAKILSLFLPKYWQKRIFPWPPLVFADYKFLVKREKSTNLRKAVTKQTNRQTDRPTALRRGPKTATSGITQKVLHEFY